MSTKSIFYIFFALLFLGCASSKVKQVEEADIQLTDSLTYNKVEEITQLITPYQQTLEATMNEVLNTSKVAMVRDKPEGILGNFVADLCLSQSRKLYVPANDKPADFCVLNNGGLRTSLPQGDITRGKIFELMPFENELVVLTLKGESVQKLIDYIAKSGGVPIAGLTLTIKQDKAENVKINNRAFQTGGVYKVITSDYLAGGGDRMDFFAEATNTESMGIKLRDCIIKHCIEEKQKGKALNAVLDQRIQHEQ